MQIRDLIQPWIAQQYADLVTALADLSDPENVHIARVRCRRLRSVLGGWHTYLPPHPKVRRRLQSLGRALSPLRDIDVIGELLAADPPADVPEWERLLEADRAPLLAAGTAVAQSAETQALLEDLAPLARPWTEGTAAAIPAATHVLAQEQQRLQQVHAMTADTHEVRKSAKRLRYNAEVISGVIPEAAAVALAAEADQEAIGAELDRLMVDAWLSRARDLRVG